MINSKQYIPVVRPINTPIVALSLHRHRDTDLNAKFNRSPGSCGQSWSKWPAKIVPPVVQAKTTLLVKCHCYTMTSNEDMDLN